MNDIYIEPIKLEEIIKILVKDNEDLCLTIQKIFNEVKSLDESKWRSPEKAEIDNQLIPYLESVKKDTSILLSDCISVLNLALSSYLKSNQYLKTNVKKLQDLNEIEEL